MVRRLAFLEGTFFPLLVLAFGLIGTPFALVVVLYLLNHPQAVPETNSITANAGGVVLLGVTVITATSFVQGEVATVGTDTVSTVVVVFAIVLAVVTLSLVGKYVWTV